jgi:hypothetical protein
LSLGVTHDLAVESAQQDGVGVLNWGVERRVDFQDLFGVGQREEHSLRSFIFQYRTEQTSTTTFCSGISIMSQRIDLQVIRYLDTHGLFRYLPGFYFLEDVISQHIERPLYDFILLCTDLQKAEPLILGEGLTFLSGDFTFGL